jgi:hypothetical protein
MPNTVTSASPRVSEVFGLDRSANPLSYVERDIDDDFKAALQSGQFSVIVIFGTSKQGKSSLRRHVLPDQFCTFVSATAGMTQEKLYRSILNRARASRPVRTEQTHTLTASMEAEAKIPAWLASLAGRIELAGQRQSVSTTEEIDIDLSDAGGVARHYVDAAGPKPIVIDNFHYFSPDMQRSIAIDIRAFEEPGVKFVVMGTWKARNYLEMQNGDLTGTVCPLSIEPWTDADFRRVIEAGEGRLTVKLDEPVRKRLIEKAAGNIGLFQTALRDLVSTKPAIEGIFADVGTVTGIYRQISTNLVEAMTDKLKRIADIGETWLAGKTRTYYILRTFVEDPESSRIEGVSLARLFDRMNRMIDQTHGARPMNEQAFLTLVRRDLLAGQQTRIETPIIAYDPDSHGLGRMIVLDSWLLVTIRNHRDQILAQF